MAEPTQTSVTVPDMNDLAKLQAEIDALEERVTALEDGSELPAPDGYKITDPGDTFIDDAFNSWRLTNGRMVEWLAVNTTEWVAAGVSYDVKLIEKWKATCFQQNNSGDWYSWQGTTWRKEAGDPSATTPPQPSGGAFYCANGQIMRADGSRFQGDGFCLLDTQVGVCLHGPDCKPLLDWFPSTGYVHIMPWGWTGYTWPQPLADAVTWLTGKGIVCEIGNWVTWPTVPTGETLKQECAWYEMLAALYKDNPLVWFTSCNEPQDWYVGLPGGSVTAEHGAVYAAIRKHSNTIIGLCPMGGTMADGLTPTSTYATMRNIHWDAHFYNWITGYSNDYNTNVNALRSEIAALQAIHCADGIIPVIVGEFGNATDGAHVDPGGWACVQAALDVGYNEHNGTGAFCLPFWPQSTGGQPNADQILDEWSLGLTQYGQQVQQTFASRAHATMATAQAEKTWPTREELRAKVEEVMAR